MIELFGNCLAKRRWPRSAIQSAQRMANGAQAERRTAAFVGYGKTIAADAETILAALDHADASGAKDQYGPISAHMSTQIRNHCVAGELHIGKGKGQCLNLRLHSHAVDTRNPHSAPEGFYLSLVQSRRIDRLCTNIEQCRVQLI